MRWKGGLDEGTPTLGAGEGTPTVTGEGTLERALGALIHHCSHHCSAPRHRYEGVEEPVMHEEMGDVGSGHWALDAEILLRSLTPPWGIG